MYFIFMLYHLDILTRRYLGLVHVTEIDINDTKAKRNYGIVRFLIFSIIEYYRFCLYERLAARLYACWRLIAINQSISLLANCATNSIKQ